MYRLWFDVEQRYKTIQWLYPGAGLRLWFDVEQRYKTILPYYQKVMAELWFDVEQRYKTIRLRCRPPWCSCGLM